MAMISELYFQMTGQFARQVEEKAIHKARRFAEIGAEISEFGTRRRFSFEVQDRVIGILKEYSGKYLKGSSNVCLAMKYNLLLWELIPTNGLCTMGHIMAIGLPMLWLWLIGWMCMTGIWG